MVIKLSNTYKMKKLTVLSCSLLLLLAGASGQGKYYTKQGNIAFDATAGAEKVQAASNTAICILDAATGALQIAVLLKGFEFEKALMQEHFNENYAESDKYPKCEFRGQVLDNNEVVYTHDGSYNVRVKGMLTLHGETREVTADAKLTISQGKIQATADFNITLADYHIAIPSLVKDKVSDHPRIRVDCSLQPLKS